MYRIKQSQRSAANLIVLVATIMLSGCASTMQGSDASVAGANIAKESNVLVQNRGAGKDNWWDSLPRAEWQALPQVELADALNWFEVYRVQPGVFAIYEPGQFEEVISYLIVGTMRALLFDTGLGIGDMRAVVSELTALPVLVINSHTHYDHIGGNHQFDNVLGVNTAYTRGRIGGLASDEVAEFVGDGWIWKELPAGFSKAAYEIKGFELSRYLEDGEVIDLGDRSVEVLFTPGHAPDALCLLDRENRLLFTGDTFYPAPLYTHLPGSDFANYKASAVRLSKLSGQVDQLLPAHNFTPVPGQELRAMAGAFKSIEAGRADYSLADGLREYDFGLFSVIVDPLKAGLKK